MDALGIPVQPALAQAWVQWLAPSSQPFFLTATEAAEFALVPCGSVHDLSPELRDTYEAWNLARDLQAVWLDEVRFRAQPRRVRAGLVATQLRHRRGAVLIVRDWLDLLDSQMLRAQADGQHFVWWPTLLGFRRDAILRRAVSTGQLPCQRTSVAEPTWRNASSILPRARRLSGTFPTGSRGNPSAKGDGLSCFATVMAAAGVTQADDESFDAWLDANCTVGGRDDRPGTVLLWRDDDQRNTHAAVTLGDGWALHKPGQEWFSPRQVVQVADVIRIAPPGVELYRYRISDQPPRKI